MHVIKKQNIILFSSLVLFSACSTKPVEPKIEYIYVDVPKIEYIEKTKYIYYDTLVNHDIEKYSPPTVTPIRYKSHHCVCDEDLYNFIDYTKKITIDKENLLKVIDEYNTNLQDTILQHKETYQDSDNGTLTYKDWNENTTTINTLMWQDNEDAKTIQKDWNGAMNYCANLELVGFDDWVLPSQEQLEALYENKIKLKNTSGNYWSSATNANYTGVNFNDGGTYNYSKTYSLYVRCVRGGQ